MMNSTKENKLDKSGNEAGSTQIICFKVGTEDYGIDILKVQEILKLPEITKLPKTIHFIKGVIELRDRVIPIIDLCKRFNIEEEKDHKEKRAIVVSIGNKKVGLAIDSVSHVVKVNSEDIEPPPPVVKGISGRYISGVAKLEERFVIILDIEQIFSKDELNSLV